MSFVDLPSSDTPLETSQSVMEVQSMALGDATGNESRREVEGIVAYIQDEFEKSRTKRYVDEQRWLQAWRNFRGKYGPDVQFTSTEKSRTFIKITKTKVLAGYAQITDVLFAGNKFPIGVEPPRIAIGVADKVNFDPKAPPEQGQESLRSNPAMNPQIAKIFGPKKNLLQKVADVLKEGVGLTPTAVTFDPAADAAKKMEKKMMDQLDEANATTSLRSLVFELCLFGTGVYKGPFVTEKEYPKWNEDGTYSPTVKIIPHFEFVSIWDCYPDSDGRSMVDCEKFIQRYRMSRTQLRALLKRPGFRKKVINEVIADGPDYTPEWWETQLVEDEDATTTDRWEVREFWGIVDKEIAKNAGLKIPKEYADFDEVQVNAWVAGGRIIRLLINPFNPARIPYNIVPYETNPYSFFGIGVAENMLDTQLLMNGFMRLAVDNAALSSNIIFEVNEDQMAPGQSMELYPGKVFRTQTSGSQKPAINSIKFENVTQEILLLFDKARQLSDEQTGMPSYAHGMTDVMSTGKTASGMSMLMGAAAQNIKAVVRNIDDYLLTPMAKDLFSFNMQFNFSKDYIGDVTVVAKGTESLMRNEVRSQKLLQLAQFAAGNPAMAPYIKWDYILREYAAALDLDEDQVVNDARAAQIQAVEMAKVQEIMGGPQGAQGQQNAQAQGNGQVPGASLPSPDDPTQNGGGNIGPGASPEPGAEGFSG